MPILSLIFLMVGCTVHPKPQAGQAALPPGQYLARSSGSLVFDPPVTAGQPQIELSRDDRNPGAFVGYDSPVATYFYLLTDDRQYLLGDNRHGSNDYYMRQAVSEKVGVTYR